MRASPSRQRRKEVGLVSTGYDDADRRGGMWHLRPDVEAARQEAWSGGGLDVAKRGESSPRGDLAQRMHEDVGRVHRRMDEGRRAQQQVVSGAVRAVRAKAPASFTISGRKAQSARRNLGPATGRRRAVA